MRKLFFTVISIVLVFFMYGLLLANFSSQVFSKSGIENSHHLFYDYRGITHVVTSHSRGSLSPKDILLEAAKANVDFLFFTDLNPIDRPYNIYGYHGDIFVFSNQKVSYLDSHVLVYSDNSYFHFSTLTDAHAQLTQHFSEPQDGETPYLAVLAHPLKADHRWQGEYPPGLDGIEVINLRSLWQHLWKSDRLSFSWSILTYPFNPDLALLRLLDDPVKEIELWDYLNRSHPTLGFLGNETTARIFHFGSFNFSFPSYARSFSFASNHILLRSELTGHEQSDKQKIFQALKKGHFYFAFDTIANPKGFAAYMRQGGETFLSGETLSLSNDLEMSIDLPDHVAVPFEIEVYRDGVIVYKSRDSKALMKVEESGVYRVRVRIQPDLPIPDKGRWFSWIYSNPFYVKDPSVN